MAQATADGLMQLVDQTAPRLRALDASRVRVKPAPAKWSIQEILGHLVDSAANNHQRFVRAQEVELLVLPKYEQDHWVDVQGYRDAPWDELVDLWALYNRHLARVIARISAHKLALECRIGSYEPATLGFIVEDYLAHQKHHLAQIDALGVPRGERAPGGAVSEGRPGAAAVEPA